MQAFPTYFIRDHFLFDFRDCRLGKKREKCKQSFKPPLLGGIFFFSFGKLMMTRAEFSFLLLLPLLTKVWRGSRTNILLEEGIWEIDTLFWAFLKVCNVFFF